MKVVLRYLGALLLLQIAGIVFAHTAFGWLPLALLVSAGYLYLVFHLARSLRLQVHNAGWRTAVALVVSALWQLPALAGSINMFREAMKWTRYDGTSDLLDFAMQTWQTPLMPLLSLLPRQETRWELAPYYLGVAVAAPLLVLLFTGLALPAPAAAPDASG